MQTVPRLTWYSYPPSSAQSGITANRSLTRSYSDYAKDSSKSRLDPLQDLWIVSHCERNAKVTTKSKPMACYAGFPACNELRSNSSAAVTAIDELAIAVLTSARPIIRIFDTVRTHTRALSGIAPEERPAVTIRLHDRVSGCLASVG